MLHFYVNFNKWHMKNGLFGLKLQAKTRKLGSNSIKCGPHLNVHIWAIHAVVQALPKVVTTNVMQYTFVPTQMYDCISLFLIGCECAMYCHAWFGG